jgi:DNA-directed RNA polymerase subunit M/transcription elongation factor TFIIS
MDFCVECGSRLVTKKVKSRKQAKVALACNKCGQTSKETAENAKINGKTI